jgi:deoxyribose-phosphate aldolase
MTSYQAARMIDVSAVRTSHSIKEIKILVQYAKKYQFINVHVLPTWVSMLADLLKDEEDILVGAPVGFPSGGHLREVKALEAEKLIADGVQEMDMVINIGKLKSGENDYVLDEIKEIADLSGIIPLKGDIIKSCGQKDKKSISFGKYQTKIFPK